MAPFIACGMGGDLHLDRLTIPVVMGNVLFLSVVVRCFASIRGTLCWRILAHTRIELYVYPTPRVVGLLGSCIG
ncbi:MAG: hypothetical protein IKJ18_09275 [Bacteroidaceae bacterium]|nr:hypothetical protein [Bacteroidaceae bacterium]